MASLFLTSKPSPHSSLVLGPPSPTFFNFHSRASFNVQLNGGNHIQVCMLFIETLKHICMLLFTAPLPRLHILSKSTLVTQLFL